MAYATKYLFKWESSNGTTREIRVQKDGYSGSVIQRRLGRAPVLKKQRNGTVFGTSLEFYAECAVDGEFAEFYTSDPKAYKVLLYTGATLLWQGYVTPELYSEPDIAPPYDVQVIATDGIGELKLYDFAAQGVKTLRQMFTYLLGYTGLGTDVYLISSMKAGTSGAGALLEKTINLDYKVGDTCYEVLTYLLDTLHATITWWRGAWIVARETNVTFSSSKVRYYNTSGNSALLTGSVVTLGKMYTSDAWPVGQLTQKIDPAKKRVTIQAPWHVNDAFVNGPMDTDTGWTKTNNASWNSTKKGYNLPDNGQTTDLATVSQSISMLGMRVPMDFVGKFCASLISGQMYNGVAGVAVDYVTSGNVTYHLGKDSEGNPTWVSGSSGNTDYDFQLRLTAVDTDDANAEALSFTIPALAVGTSYPAGTLTVRIVGRSAIVFSASLDVVITKGYQDRLHIDNGARGEEGTVEIAIGRETSDIDYYKAFMQGLLLDSGSLITSFKDDNLTTATDFLSYISRDYARSFALPRIVRTGKVYLEDGVSYPPLVLSKGAVDYWLETFSWDMYEDELDISARSLPTATITVESEVIAEYGTGTASSSSSSGGGATPITPIPSVLPNPYALTFGNKSYDGSEPVTLTASDIGALTGITAAMVNAAYGFTISGTAGSTYNLGNLHTHSNKSVLDGITSGLVTNWNTAYTNNHTHSNKSLLDSMTINWDNYFGIDSDGNVYVKKDGDNPRHFYSYGAVSAGGLSTGGGTGGIDLAAMWASLQNNDIVDTYDTYQFAAAHLPTCGSGLSYTISNGIATGINVSFPVTSVAGKTGAVTLAFSDITGTASTSQIPDLSGTYLPLSGGLISSSDTDCPLRINSSLSGSNDVWLYFYKSNVAKSAVGYYDGLAFLSNEANYYRLGITDAGTPVFRLSSSSSSITYTLYHTGNLSPITTTNWTSYIGTSSAPVGYAANATAATYASILYSVDKRSDYPAQIADPYKGRLCFVYSGTLGISGYGTWYDVFLMRSYGDDSGGDDNAIMFDKNGADVWHSHIPFGSTSSWGTLYKFWDSGNFNPADYLPLAGGTMSNTNLVTNLNADLLDGKHSSDFYMLKGLRSDIDSIYSLRHNFGTYDMGDYGGTYAGEYPAPYGAYLSIVYSDKNIGALMFFDTPTSNALGHIYVRTRGAGNTNTQFSELGTLAYTTDNVASATKLQTARTIWGQSFNGTGNVDGRLVINYDYEQPLQINANYTTSPGAGSASAYSHVGFAYNQGLLDNEAYVFEIGHHANYYCSAYIGYVYRNGVSSYLTLGLYGVDRVLNIAGNGYVGIGTTSPTEKVHIVGKIRCDRYIENNDWDVINLHNIGSWGTASGKVVSVNVTDGQGTVGKFGVGYDGTGFFYVGSLFNNGYAATGQILKVTPAGTYVAGVIHASTGIFTEGYVTAGAASSSSDARLKDNIKTFDYSTELLMAIKPREWDWNKDSHLEGHAAGFVAQEMLPVLPYAVGSINDEKFGSHYTLNYDMLHALEVSGLQSHETRIQQLERESREKDAKIAELENQLRQRLN